MISAAIAAGIRVRGERGTAGQDADRLQRAEGDQGEAADRAGDEEEDRRAADRERGRDAGADQDHGAEREPAAAAAGEEDVGALLDHADVEGLAPAEPAVEGAAQGDDEAQHREQLQDEGGDDPAGLGVGEAVADRLQERDPDHGRGGEQRRVPPASAPLTRIVWPSGAFLRAASASSVQSRLARRLYELEHP